MTLFLLHMHTLTPPEKFFPQDGQYLDGAGVGRLWPALSAVCVPQRVQNVVWHEACAATFVLNLPPLLSVV